MFPSTAFVFRTEPSGKQAAALRTLFSDAIPSYTSIFLNSALESTLPPLHLPAFVLLLVSLWHFLDARLFPFQCFLICSFSYGDVYIMYVLAFKF